MSEDTRERIARAIFGSVYTDGPRSWAATTEKMREEYRRFADAALAVVSPSPVDADAERLLQNAYDTLSQVYWAARNGQIHIRDMQDVLDRHRPLLGALTDRVVSRVRRPEMGDRGVLERIREQAALEADDTPSGLVFSSIANEAEAALGRGRSLVDVRAAPPVGVDEGERLARAIFEIDRAREIEAHNMAEGEALTWDEWANAPSQLPWTRAEFVHLVEEALTAVWSSPAREPDLFGVNVDMSLEGKLRAILEQFGHEDYCALEQHRGPCSCGWTVAQHMIWTLLERVRTRCGGSGGAPVSVGRVDEDAREWTLVRLSNSDAWCISSGEVEARPEGTVDTASGIIVVESVPVVPKSRLAPSSAAPSVREALRRILDERDTEWATDPGDMDQRFVANRYAGKLDTIWSLAEAALAVSPSLSCQEWVLDPSPPCESCGAAIRVTGQVPETPVRVSAPAPTEGPDE